jgi:hypothetical protein
LNARDSIRAPLRQAAELVEDGKVVAVRKFAANRQDQTLMRRALELGQNYPALLALLWPERVDSNGRGDT